ncbi:hypothetical protein [Spirulina major]|uniref:hypothetical protein n=1 Tax=Spirulina major TaxID=270636 RepID=UPI001114DC65|nr:hypothetical protein [Spirulina major]
MNRPNLPMRRDLQQLRITPKDLAQWSGVVFPAGQIAAGEGRRVRSLLGSVLAAFGVFFLAETVIRQPLLDIGLGLLPLGVVGVRILGETVGWSWTAGQVQYLELDPMARESLDALTAEVENFNTMVRSLHLNDQLQAVGNPGLAPPTRQRLLAALKLLRQDLRQAIQTERILRENRDLVDQLALNPSELFIPALTSLQTLQLEAQATDIEDYLSNAVQIALDVQTQLKALQRSEN